MITLQIHSSRRRKQCWALWSSRQDWQLVVCERKGPWDMGPRTQNGTWKESQERKCWKRRGDKAFLQETLLSKLPNSHLGKWVESSWLNNWFLHNDLFLYAVPGWETESRVLKYGCLLFILSPCVLPVGMRLWLVSSKDMIDVKMQSSNSNAAWHPPWLLAQAGNVEVTCLVWQALAVWLE